MLLLKNTKVDVIPIPATLGNVLVYQMTFFAPAIHSGPAKHAMKKVNIIVLPKYLCNIFVDVLPYTVFPQKRRKLLEEIPNFTYTYVKLVGIILITNVIFIASPSD